jgi:hypothetical protein
VPGHDACIPDSGAGAGGGGLALALEALRLVAEAAYLHLVDETLA